MKCLYPIADCEVYRYEMPVILSNMYVMIGGEEALIVDPHISIEAENLIRSTPIKSCTILLTHEHFDHISGVNRFRQLFSCHVVCTEECARLIEDPRRNSAATFGALFLNRSVQIQEEVKKLLDPTYRCHADSTYRNYAQLEWNHITFTLREMRGHSQGSQIIEADRFNVFTGDNLVPGQQTVTRLPGGSNSTFREKVVPYLSSIHETSIIFPGHGSVGPISSEEMQYGLHR